MSTWNRRQLYCWLNNIQFWLLPGTCLVCRRTTGRPSDICLTCQRALPRIERPCPRCGLPLPVTAPRRQSCGACLAAPPPFLRCVAPLRYSPPVNHLVGGFKYHANLAGGRLLGEWLAAAVAGAYRESPLPTLIVPVPLHTGRLRRRGFNQARELARVVSRRLDLPVNNRIVTRQRATAAQMGLNARERRRNLRGAFALHDNRPLTAGPVIALVDDVVTTGSTAAIISNLLLKGGASEVHVWAAARTCR